MLVRRASLADGNELTVLLVQFPEFIFQHREEPSLHAVPEFAEVCQSAHVVCLLGLRVVPAGWQTI